MDEFSDFYHAHKDRVFRTVLAAGRHRAVAEDAVAEGFTRAFARWSQLERHPNPVAWTILTALNVQRSWWRRVRREILDPAPQWSGTLGAPAEATEHLRAALARLPRRQREVVALRLLADLSPAETGEMLGISASTVGVHLSRALAALRSSLSPPLAAGAKEPSTSIVEQRPGQATDIAPEVGQ